MKDSSSKEDSQRRHRFLSLKPAELRGYSIKRVLLFGLIPPAFVLAGLFLGLWIFTALEFSLFYKLVFTVGTTFAGFALGTFVIVKLTDKIVKFARVGKE
ncbi:hypothetical protein [Candidatus Hecatella orcuttiae]|uniref:hypothetical protein n=1 Tax=Candidatus Hecatella orcuttiae TaxID=1935119 RepID=UPI002867F10A|nr:hypothetical protein [Candidatus Hecatella orcuttiae]